MSLPREVVAEDHRLDEANEAASTALAELRWRWTLDESNPDRVGFSEYARAIGRTENAVRQYARAFAEYSANPEMTLSDARARVGVSEDRLAATEAVAEARGLTLETAKHARRDEVKRIHAIAAEKAERKGTTVADEAPAVAAWIVKSEKADARTREDRAERVDFRLIEVEAKVRRMIRLGLEVVSVVREVEWDDEAVELVEESIANLKSIVGLIDVALAGAVDVDWDGELERLTGGNE